MRENRMAGQGSPIAAPPLDKRLERFDRGPSRDYPCGPARPGLLVLQKVLGRHLTSRARYDLLLFWSRCPGGWSGRAAVGPRTRLPRQQIDQALDELVVEAVVRRIDEKCGAYYFALTEDPMLREAVRAFGRLTNSERHHLFQLCSDGSKAVGPQSHGTPRRAGTRQAEPHG